MTYELAKKLQDIGFPLIDCVGYAFNGEKKVVSFEMDTNDFPKDWIYIPPLSELIEACGEEFVALKRQNIFHSKNGGKMEKDLIWLCYPDKPLTDNKPGVISATVGKTPEEAVANLWIKKVALTGKIC